jgi:hypothetical protein
VRGSVVAIGIVVLIVGVVAYSYTEYENFLGYSVKVGQPYQAVGSALIVLGFAGIILGVALKGEKQSELDEWRRRGHEREVAALSRTTATSQAISTTNCTKCGQMLRPTDQFCPKCGAQRDSTAQGVSM